MKLYLMLCLALGGCVAGGDEPGLDGDEPGLDGDEPATSTTEQGVTQTLYDVRAFGGNLFAENFYYVTAPSCSPGFVRSGTPTTHWTSQSGGHCVFQGWLTPSNPADCRAMIWAHTAGGWFGGTCQTFVTEETAPAGSYSYAAANTSSATAYTDNRTILLGAGQTLTIGTCGVATSSFAGDTYLRLFGPAGSQVAFNDDSCSGVGSRIVFTAPASGAYEIRGGCWSTSSCSGTVAWTIQ
jgi:hypothetical protein